MRTFLDDIDYTGVIINIPECLIDDKDFNTIESSEPIRVNFKDLSNEQFKALDKVLFN